MVLAVRCDLERRSNIGQPPASLPPPSCTEQPRDRKLKVVVQEKSVAGQACCVKEEPHKFQKNQGSRLQRADAVALESSVGTGFM